MQTFFSCCLLLLKLNSSCFSHLLREVIHKMAVLMFYANTCMRSLPDCIHIFSLPSTHCLWQHMMRGVSFASSLTAKVGWFWFCFFFNYLYYLTGVSLCHIKRWYKLALHILTRKLVPCNKKQQKTVLHYEHPEVHDIVILKTESFSELHLVFVP